MLLTRPSLPFMLLLALLLAQLVMAFWVTMPSFFISDEITYARMAHAMASEGALHVWNGFEDYPSAGLILSQTSPLFDHLYPKYPAFYALIAAPFFLAFGLKGLFLLNALALVGVTWLTHRLAMLLFGDAPLALAASGLLLLGTYIWPQSQAIWPHMLALFFLLGAANGVAQAWRHGDPDHRHALLAGLSFAAAFTIRLDSILLAPALALPFLFARPVRWKSLFAIALTASVGLLFLLVTNVGKFGSFNPLDYGHTVSVRIEGKDYTRLTAPHLRPLFLYVLVFLAPLLWRWGEGQRWRNRMSGRGYAAIWAVVTCAIALLFPAEAHMVLSGFHDTLWNLQEDTPPLQVLRATLQFSPDGAHLYSGEIKRALLQSCPFLLMAVVPLLYGPTGQRPPLLWLWACAAGFLIFYGSLGWDGGYGYNMRYFLPCLPFLSIAAAAALRILPWRRGVLAAVLLITCAMAYWLTSQPLALREIGYRHLPLVMAILAVAALLAAHRRPAVAGAASAVIAATLFWGGVTAAIAHYPLYQQRRTVTQDTNRQIGSVLADDALYIGPQWQVAALPLEGRPIRIFNPGLLDDAQLREALTWHLEQGVRIYLAPDEPSDWHRLIAPWGLEAKEHTHGIREIVRKARL